MGTLRLVSIWAMAVCVTADIAGAEDSQLTALFKEHAYGLALDGERLGGDGAAFLIEATREAQFVAFAEPHNVREVPQLFTAMFKTLQAAHAYQYVALETGPAIMEAASSDPVRGDQDALEDLYRRFPDSFHFYTDQELQSMAEIGAASTAKTAPLWGVDQVHAVPFIAHRLADLAANDDTRAKAMALYEGANAHNRSLPLNGHRYMFTRDGFDALDEWFSGDASAEARFLIDQLKLSHEVYRLIRSDAPGDGYRSNVMREENMKALFMKRYREAQAAGDATPRVLARLGHWHLMRGKSPGNAYSFGNFLSEFAKSNGMTSFQLGVSVVNEPGKYWSLSENEDFKPLTDAASTSEWRIIDLRPMRGLAHAGALPGLTPSLRDWIFQYDAALLIGGADRGTYRVDIERKREERRRVREQSR